MSGKLRKRLLSALFFVGVFVLTFWYVFHDENLNQVLYFLGSADWRYVVPAVFFVIAFILGESVVIYYLLRKLGTKSRFFHCAIYSFVGFFYSAITPSASGGQPMQVVAMRRNGIPGSVSSVVLAIVTITYKLVLVLLGVGVLVLRPACIMQYLDGVESLMYLGLALNVVFIIGLFMVVFDPKLARGAVNLIFRLVSRFYQFKNPDRITSRLDATIQNYRGTADFFRSHPIIIIHVFLITLVQRLFLFSVVWLTYLAFGLEGESAVVIILLYAMISVAVDMLPLPGGMGISETLFLAIYEPIFSEALVIPGMLVCRGISYYTQLVISALMTAFAHFFLGSEKTS